MNTALGEKPVQKSEVTQRLERARNLPSLPGVAVRIIELSEDPNASMSAVAKLVANDPALTARLLRIANSPLYAQRRVVENLTQALMLLGLNATLSLALGFCLVNEMSGKKSGKAQLDYERIWRRALIAATAARALAPRIGEHSPEDMFLAGLLQDIGVLALDRVLAADGYGEVVNAIADHEDLPAEENARFGIDHVQAGRWIMKQWQLPQHLRDAVLASHATESTDAAATAIGKAVAVASRVADALLDGPDGAALQRFKAVGASMLGLGDEELLALLKAVDEQIPDLEQLFDIEMPGAAEREGLLEHARELLLLRGLRIQQELDEVIVETGRLQAHAHRLEQEVRRDGLTGVFNRSHIDRELQRAFGLAAETGSALSVMFVDLDRFKSINDTWGHAVGDEVLIGVSRRMEKELRHGHTLGRYGGEEFVVLLPGVGSDAAVAIAQRLRKTLATVPVAKVGATQVFVTFSAGLATHGERHYFKDSGDLVWAADRMMYAAKVAGRDRLHVYTGDDG